MMLNVQAGLRPGIAKEPMAPQATVRHSTYGASQHRYVSHEYDHRHGETVVARHHLFLGTVTLGLVTAKSISASLTCFNDIRCPLSLVKVWSWHLDTSFWGKCG